MSVSKFFVINYSYIVILFENVSNVCNQSWFWGTISKLSTLLYQQDLLLPILNN